MTSSAVGDVADAVAAAALSPTTAAEELAAALYRGWYTRAAEHEIPAPDGPPTAVDLGLVDALRAADAAGDAWEAGWSVRAVSSRGRVALVRDGEERIVDRVDVLPDQRPCLPPGPGASARVVGRRDALGPGGASWMTAGAGWDLSRPPSGCLRVYLNVAPPDAPRLVRALTSRLQESVAGYALKLPSAPAGFARADAAVLYLPDDVDAGVVVPLLESAARTVPLRPATPRLTLRLGTGTGLAEDPRTGQSFGEHRCGLLAEALRRSDETGPPMRRIRERFLEAGVDPDRPHVGTGSRVDDEAWRLRPGR